MSKHSPTPWDTRLSYGIGIYDANQMLVCKADSGDAAHIVRCVNAHDGLVAAVQELLNCRECSNCGCRGCEHAHKLGSAALAAANGE